MSHKEETRFSLVKKERSVTLEKENGEEQKVTVREITGKNRDEYMTLVGGKARFNAEGKPIGLKNFSGLHSKLLSMSLYNEENTLFKVGEIDGMPASAREGLFDIARELSGLDGGAQAEAGNVSTASA